MELTNTILIKKDITKISGTDIKNQIINLNMMNIKILTNKIKSLLGIKLL